MTGFRLLFSIVLLLGSSAAIADETNDNANLCEHAAQEVRMDACTWLIQSQTSDAQLRAFAFVSRGMIYTEEGQLARAISEFDSAIALDPASPYGFYNRGNVYLALRNSDKAFADFTTAIDLNPRMDYAWHNRALVEDARGRHEAAIEGMSQAIEIDPIPGHYFNRGRIYFHAGRFADAIDDFTAAATHLPEFVEPYGERCRARAAWNRDLDEARDDCERAVSADGKNASFRIYRAFLRLRLKDAIGAIADASAAIEYPTGPQNPFSGRFVDDVDTADALYLRSVAEKMLGRTEAAKVDLVAAVARVPVIERRYAPMNLAPN